MQKIDDMNEMYYTQTSEYRLKYGYENYIAVELWKVITKFDYASYASAQHDFNSFSGIIDFFEKFNQESINIWSCSNFNYLFKDFLCDFCS